MKNNYKLTSLILMLFVVFNIAKAQTTIYVKTTGSDANDGSSWDNAFQTLQKALSAATTGSQIWVAKGTYYPDQGGSRAMGDRSASFTMLNDVSIYGGFAGTEDNLNDRNWNTNVTILSGDIGTTGDNSDNAYHVVFNNNNGLNNTALLDGFTIVAGNANGSYPNNEGGGMCNISSNPALSNISFISNAANYGGGMYNDYSNSTLTNVVFQNNSGYSGGGMYNSSSVPTLINAVFINNSAIYQGGAIVDNSSAATLINVSFQGNSASQGGGMFTFSSPPLWSTVCFGTMAAAIPSTTILATTQRLPIACLMQP